ncbi:efflux transporter outer membrane subunit [Enterobacter hormaechei]|uniref:efflux transporter outer membrane subunit n=1 Tax=Enterobacteriaceae TaxID=543 RepID=UPI000A3A0588|nr:MULTISPECIES: efflux transporter outer membrane subunit [Enterobacteriaceae]EKE6958190.1 efflux transporter outer membrane subunit [Escherichia coli]EKN3489893.1 efflux transporter outer membrane subunit [Yersinia enterocolitica]ELU1431071.1 efflux transporter outer membrane subunit [Raoultella planticola]HBM7597514.1 efflux transporter outer membrane subunit [Enterobacter hormaechei subsp. xiangfangensis]EKN3878851.1 efflux transporter outer membrane subunit [Yersinia enterocolitica]
MIPETTRFSSLTITLFSALLLSGCGLMPDYHRPETAIPLKWNQQEVSLQGTNVARSSAPYFNDEKLQQLIKLTIAGNKDLQVSALNLKKVGEQYGADRLSTLPNIGMTVEKTAAHEPAGIYDTVDTGAVTYHQFDAKLVSASWEIDFWGRLRSLKEASLNEYLAAGATSRALRINLIEQTVSAYFNYLSSREAAEISTQLLKNKLTEKEMVHQAYLEGALTQSDVIDADKDADRARSELMAFKLQAQQNYNALQLLVGQPLPASLFNSVTLSQDWRFTLLQSGLPSDVLLRRPDVVAAEYALKAANARIGAARAAFFPSVSITAAGGSTSAELSNLLSAGTASWSFVPSLNLPIFDGGKNAANLSIAELNKQVEIVNYQKAIQQAFRDVSDALAGQAAMKARYGDSEAIYTAAMTQYQMSVMTQTAGQLSTEGLVQKNNELLEARKQLLESRLKYLIQGVKLYSVLGGDSAI